MPRSMFDLIHFHEIGGVVSAAVRATLFVVSVLTLLFRKYLLIKELLGRIAQVKAVSA